MNRDDRDLTIVLVIASILSILFVVFVLCGEKLLPEVWQILLGV